MWIFYDCWFLSVGCLAADLGSRSAVWSAAAPPTVWAAATTNVVEDIGQCENMYLNLISSAFRSKLAIGFVSYLLKLIFVMSCSKVSPYESFSCLLFACIGCSNRHLGSRSAVWSPAAYATIWAAAVTEVMENIWWCKNKCTIKMFINYLVAIVA